MARRKKNKKISKKELSFNILSILVLLTICLYFGYRSIYYYTKQNNVNTSKVLAEIVKNNNKVTTEKNGFHKEKDGYAFKGIVENNYVKYSNRIFRIMKISDNDSIQIVSDRNEGIIIWGDESSYKNSNLYTWLTNKENGIYLNTLSDSNLLKEMTYNENTLLNNKIVKTKDKYTSKVRLLSIDDYIEFNGKNSFLNNGTYFWLLGRNKEKSNLYVDEKGSIDEAETYESYGIRPVMTLSSKTKITSGTGSKIDPYVIETKENNYTGSYVKLGTDTWYVYSDVNNILKLSLNGYIPSNQGELKKIFSSKTGVFDLTDKTGIAYYLNNTVYNSLAYKNILLDIENNIGEISNETGFNIKNIYSNKVISKVSLLNIFDYNANEALTDYYYINNTSSVGSMIYINNNKGLIDEDSIDNERHVVPTISIDKTILKNGLGTIDNPYVME